jgi:hypothetical protein
MRLAPAKCWNLFEILVCFFASITVVSQALACPICGVPTITLPERLARADVALLVEWVAAQPAKDALPESTTYEIVQVHRDGTGKFKAAQTVTVPQFTSGKAGNLFFLMGQKDDKLGTKWELGPALAVSETSYQYIIQAPSPETPADKRLAYFIKFLEFPDITIANDAFAQFVNAPTKDIAAVADKLPREKIRNWLADVKTPVTRQSGYGLMLGLCGSSNEARFLEQRIAEVDPERQTGIEGVIFGYLLLAGEQGLSTIEKAFLANRRATDDKLYPAYLATRYYWYYGNGKIPRPRLQLAMRRLLDQQTFADSVIITLAEWKDWSLHKRLMELYDTKVEVSTKKAIIKYMIASTKDASKDGDNIPAHVVAGRKCLDELRRRDPKLVEDTEKYFFLN